MLLIGSQALKHFGNQFLSTAVQRSWDMDWIASYKDYEKYKSTIHVQRMMPINKGKKIILFENDNIHEIEIAWSDSVAQELLDIAKKDTSVAVPYKNYYIATPDLIFTLKKSHRFLRNSPHFLKTMHDYKHLRKLSCKVPDSLKEWYKKRVDETYWYKHPNLNVSKNDFFKDDMVPYKYDHDTLHLAVKHFERPAYDYFKPDTKDVYCSKKMFESCSEDVKLLSVLEEAYVLALERSQIPAPNVVSPRESFEIALSKVCSSITSGWWREYAYENYFKVLDMYSDSYIDKFKEGLSSGIIKPHKGNYPH